MPSNNYEYSLFLPQIIIGVGIVLSVLIEIFTKKGKQLLPWFSIVLFLAAASNSIMNISRDFVLFGGMIEVGGKPAIFNFIFNMGAALVVLTSVDYLKKYKGELVTVTDEEILEASVRLSGKTGIFTEPAAAARNPPSRRRARE